MDSPFLGQFCDENNQELIEQSQTQSVASSISTSKENNRKVQQNNGALSRQHDYYEREVETLGAIQRKGNQVPTYHN